MKQRAAMLLLLVAGLVAHTGCDSKTDTVTKGREAVKEVVTQPFNTLDATKESLKQSEDKTKAALEEIDKQLK
ncbi:MAG TPA: hypothetical protein VJ733_08520 [Candidatus Binatia bacterium]|nr:hypothetical protein [Candidatus Binatia bacterium]